MRAIENCLDALNEFPLTDDNLFTNLKNAVTDSYDRKSNKRARYNPKNSDKKPLGDPKIRKLTTDEKKKLRQIEHQIAA